MKIHKMIAHTMLKADATTEVVKRYCEETKEAVKAGADRIGTGNGIVLL